jgi:Uma2 family endonuclease
MSTRPNTFLTPEEYLAIERKADRKSEYYRGEMFAMAGASRRHNLILVNVAAELRQLLKARPCEVYSSDMRNRVTPVGLYTYPDASVVCGEPEFADDQKDTLLNPVVIVEILSDSTRDYDRSRKFQYYRELASLREYLTIEQDSPRVERWARQAEGGWLLTEFKDLEQTVHLASIDCELPLREIYDKVDWTA